MNTPEENAQAVETVETPETTKKPAAKKAAKKAAKPAAKKAAKKAAKPAAKKVAGPRVARGHVYELTAQGSKLDPKEISAQQQFILSYFKKHASRATVAQVAEAAEKDQKGFPCRQPRKRAVAYYFTDWKNAGYLKFAKAEKAAA